MEVPTLDVTDSEENSDGTYDLIIDGHFEVTVGEKGGKAHIIPGDNAIGPNVPGNAIQEAAKEFAEENVL